MRVKFNSLYGGLLLLTLMTAASGQSPVGAEPPANVRARIRVACVGDSITFGQGVQNREANCYPAVLGRLLGSNYEVVNFGVSGATLMRNGDYPYWNLPEFKAVGEFRPNIIILMLGTNDTKMNNWLRKAQFGPDLKNMLDHFSKLPGLPHIYACYPPPLMGLLRKSQESAIEKDVIPIIRAAAAERGVGLIDVHAALKDKPGLLPDGVHPNAEGATIIAQTVYQALMANAMR
ncbi:MAG TPA: GDSL-type esterase/lipase family protein [Kiritimatiellia bacterium]|nr:GDSL-type esterase/lipase family protein [Kiritimatiellia bacterium]